MMTSRIKSWLPPFAWLGLMVAPPAFGEGEVASAKMFFSSAQPDGYTVTVTITGNQGGRDWALYGDAVSRESLLAQGAAGADGEVKSVKWKTSTSLVHRAFLVIRKRDGSVESVATSEPSVPDKSSFGEPGALAGVVLGALLTLGSTIGLSYFNDARARKAAAEMAVVLVRAELAAAITTLKSHWNQTPSTATKLRVFESLEVVIAVEKLAAPEHARKIIEDLKIIYGLWLVSKATTNHLTQLAALEERHAKIK